MMNNSHQTFQYTRGIDTGLSNFQKMVQTSAIRYRHYK